MSSSMNTFTQRLFSHHQKDEGLCACALHTSFSITCFPKASEQQGAQEWVEISVPKSSLRDDKAEKGEYFCYTLPLINYIIDHTLVLQTQDGWMFVSYHQRCWMAYITSWCLVEGWNLKGFSIPSKWGAKEERGSSPTLLLTQDWYRLWFLKQVKIVSKNGRHLITKDKQNISLKT